MRNRATSLIEQIEAEALDPSIPISSPLRKLIALGGKAGSSDLREWASRELRGYAGSGVELPEYRHAGATIRIDGATINTRITGQQISPRMLPDPVNKHIDEAVPLWVGVAEIEAMIENAKTSEGEIKLTLPKSQDVVRLMNYEMQQRGEDYQTVTAVYWSVSHVSLEGVLDQVRTRLVELVAEMRAEMPEQDEVPSAAVADNAVQLVIHENAGNVTVNAAQTTGTGNTTTANTAQASGTDSTANAIATDVGNTTIETPTEKRSMLVKIGGALAGVATIIGTAVAIAAWQGWNPF